MTAPPFCPIRDIRILIVQKRFGTNIILTLDDALAKGETPPAESALVKGMASYVYQVALSTVGPNDCVLFIRPHFSRSHRHCWIFF